MKPENTAVVILAAGNSSRMHRLKAFLPFDDKSVFLEQILKIYIGWGCGEIVLVVNEEAEYQLLALNDLPDQISIVLNFRPELERFYSVKLGLKSIQKAEYCFIQNIDNPYITEEILTQIYNKRSQDHFVKPVYQNKGGHPILLGQEIISHIIDYQENDANLKAVLSTQKCAVLEMPDNTVLININTPDAYDELTSILYS